MWTSASWCSPRLSCSALSRFTYCLRRLVGQQAAEALEQVAELLGVLAEIVDLLRRGVRPDQATLLDRAPCALERFVWRPACRAVDRLVAAAASSPSGSSSHVRHSAISSAARSDRSDVLELDVRVGAASFEELTDRRQRRSGIDPERIGVARPTRADRHRGRGRPRSDRANHANPSRAGSRTAVGMHRLGRRRGRCGCVAPRCAGRAGTPGRSGRWCLASWRRSSSRGWRARRETRRSPPFRIEWHGRRRREAGEIDAGSGRALRQGVGRTRFESDAPAATARTRSDLLGVPGDLVDLDRREPIDAGAVDDPNLLVQLGDRHHLAGPVAPHTGGPMRAVPGAAATTHEGRPVPRCVTGTGPAADRPGHAAPRRPSR